MHGPHRAALLGSGATFSGRDLILLAGGLFLIGKAHGDTREAGGRPPEAARAPGTRPSGVVQIAILDIVFSLDSVITAVGMVDASG